MFIKEIIISGFKSYRETIRIQDVHPGYNVVVGPNGSGKSNFFAALEFALSTDSRAGNPEELNALLFHGQISNTIAYVEIIFDNKDRKLPYNTNTVVFKRVVGAKKDRYFVNKKECESIKEFLEIAGITNPYYIVKQGKITEMATANEKARLEILYEVSGSKAYEEKRAESQKMLEDCQKKIESFENLVQSLDETFENLTEQSKELQSFLKLERKKRAIQYLVHNREKEALASNMEKLEAEHIQLCEESKPAQGALYQAKKQIYEMNLQIESFVQQQTFLNLKKKDLESEIPECSSRIAVMENQLKDTIENHRLSLQSENEVKNIAVRLRSTKDALESLLREKIAPAKEKEATASNEYNACKANMENHKEKRGRTAQFATKAERDSWISAEISVIAKIVDAKNTERERHMSSIANISGDLKELAKELKENKKDWENQRTKLTELESSSLGYNHITMLEKRSVKWNDLNRIGHQQNIATENVARLTDQLRKQGANAVIVGWKNIQSLLTELRQTPEGKQKLRGYHGILLDNIIRWDSSVTAAVEETAGPYLFYHLVDSHEIGRMILKEFNARKLSGEVNFLSLAELRVIVPDYSANTKEYTRIISKIDFKEQVSPAMKFVFGGTLLCTSLEVAAAASKLHKMNCVTLEGDRVSRKGFMKGGYRNPKLSKIALGTDMLKELAKLEKFNNDKNAIEKDFMQLENDIVECVKNKEQMETSNCALRSDFERIQIRKDMCERKIHLCEIKLQQECRKFEELETLIKSFDWRRENLLQERSEPMSAKSIQYGKQMKRFKADVAEKLKRFEHVKLLRKEAEAQKMDLEKSISFSEKKIEELKLLGKSAAALEKARHDLEKQLDDLGRVKRNQESEWTKVTSEYSDLQKKLEDYRFLKDNALEAISVKEAQNGKFAKALENNFAKQLEAKKRVGEVEEQLSKCGTIPRDIADYEDKSSGELCTELKSISKSLRALGNVNREAIEKLEKVRELKENIFQEKNKYDAINAKIVELDETVDNKKGEAVFKVFQALHKEFRNIFRKLVPQGNIRMFLAGEGGGQVSVISENNEGVLDLFRWSKFEGLAIEVNFVSQDLRNGTRDLSSLSGGQKSLISVALLLAIQRCDPVPLYIFDEIDQALDLKSATAVAGLIKEFSKNAQFICTTFSRQFVEKADASFGVVFRNQASHVAAITLRQALAFVKSDDSDDSESPGSPPDIFDSNYEWSPSPSSSL